MKKLLKNTILFLAVSLSFSIFNIGLCSDSKKSQKFFLLEKKYIEYFDGIRKLENSIKVKVKVHKTNVGITVTVSPTYKEALALITAKHDQKDNISMELKEELLEKIYNLKSIGSNRKSTIGGRHHFYLDYRGKIDDLKITDYPSFDPINKCKSKIEKRYKKLFNKGEADLVEAIKNSEKKVNLNPKISFDKTGNVILKANFLPSSLFEENNDSIVTIYEKIFSEIPSQKESLENDQRVINMGSLVDICELGGKQRQFSKVLIRNIDELEVKPKPIAIKANAPIILNQAGKLEKKHVKNDQKDNLVSASVASKNSKDAKMIKLPAVTSNKKKLADQAEPKKVKTQEEDESRASDNDSSVGQKTCGEKILDKYKVHFSKVKKSNIKIEIVNDVSGGKSIQVTPTFNNLLKVLEKEQKKYIEELKKKHPLSVESRERKFKKYNEMVKGLYTNEAVSAMSSEIRGDSIYFKIDETKICIPEIIAGDAENLECSKNTTSIKPKADAVKKLADDVFQILQLHFKLPAAVYDKKSKTCIVDKPTFSSNLDTKEEWSGLNEEMLQGLVDTSFSWSVSDENMCSEKFTCPIEQTNEKQELVFNVTHDGKEKRKLICEIPKIGDVDFSLKVFYPEPKKEGSTKEVCQIKIIIDNKEYTDLDKLPKKVSKSKFKWSAYSSKEFKKKLKSCDVGSMKCTLNKLSEEGTITAKVTINNTTKEVDCTLGIKPIDEENILPPNENKPVKQIPQPPPLNIPAEQVTVEGAQN